MQDIQNENVGQAQEVASGVTAAQPAETTYTKDDVVRLMKKRVERSHNSFYKRYGVKDLQGLDDLFSRARSYNDMNAQFGEIQMKNSELARENAFLKNNINPEKYNDIIAYFKGNDLNFSEEELLKALGTHPEWLKPSNVPTTTIKTLGSEAHTMPAVDEKAIASKLFGVDL